MKRHEYAAQKYEELGVDVDKALETLSGKPISIHCWQGDDVTGFDSSGAALSGGIQATGSYPGKARDPSELMADFEKAISHIPGKKRINLHASYALFDDNAVDRDKLEPEHFLGWVEYAKRLGIGIDFNTTYFGHPMAEDNLTLSSPDDEVRNFWVRHSIACRRICSWIANELGDEVLCNIWVQDGYKDIPADRLGPRLRLRDSLDQIYSEELPGVIDCVESKLFGIGLESYTAGSSEFYLSYAATRPGVYPLLDNGHFHPTESISDKIASILVFKDKLPVHITRSIRWDSDHVVLFDDEVKEIAKEIVRCGALNKALLGLDYFDASVNRVAAWVLGTRNLQKALLNALLMPHDYMRELQDSGRFTELMVLQEELKVLPFGLIWEHWCKSEGVAPGMEWFDDIMLYEEEVLLKR